MPDVGEVMKQETRETRETFIHPTALVDPGAELGQGVQVGPFAILEAGIQVGDRTEVHGHTQILRGTTLGSDNVIFPGAILGGIPQDRKYGGEESQLVIGDRNQIREQTTFHRGTEDGGLETKVGNDCLFMAGCHVAHDCIIEDGVTMANNVLLAGHVHIEQGASLSGASAVHQFATIGTLAFVGGLARVAMDVPPYLIFEGRPGRPRGLNVIGLQRAGLGETAIDSLKSAYRILFHGEETRMAALKQLEERADLSAEVANLVRFLRMTDLDSRGRFRESLRKSE